MKAAKIGKMGLDTSFLIDYFGGSLSAKSFVKNIENNWSSANLSSTSFFVPTLLWQNRNSFLSQYRPCRTSSLNVEAQSMQDSSSVHLLQKVVVSLMLMRRLPVAILRMESLLSSPEMSSSSHVLQIYRFLNTKKSKSQKRPVDAKI